MSVPDFQSLMLPSLQAVAEPGELTVGDTCDVVADRFGLTAEDLQEVLPSGTQTRFRNRVNWALNYMKHAGVLDSPARGRYRITERGRELLAKNPERISTADLKQFEEFREFEGRTSARSAQDAVERDEDSTPQERLDAAYAELREHVAADLLERLRVMDPVRFERVVLEVLSAMGYGGKDPSRASMTATSYDHGLDGIIKEDELGLDQVVVQAKRYNSVVDVKLVREFAGSLDEHGTNKGVFFTTDKFTGPAKDYVKSIPKRIVLIDGPELARLMVKHHVGVTVTDTLTLTRVDNDYFEQDLDL